MMKNLKLYNYLLTSLTLIAVFLSIFISMLRKPSVQYLSGTGSDNTVDWEFFCTEGRLSGYWTTIPVPSCWELQGFGTYNYGHDKYENRGMEKGLYRHRFMAPADWKDKTVNLVFDGSMTDTEVKINGKSAGLIHQGAFYRFSYDITSLLRFGRENLLEVTVAKHSANEVCKRSRTQSRLLDFWRYIQAGFPRS
jgi:beta-galactosidase/beta-glucuronidase